MNPIEYKITLDCRRAESQVTITAKQGEASGRKITFSLNEGRLPYKVPSGVTAVLRAKKPSGAVLYNTCTVTADGNVEYIITTQTVAEVGKLPCELQLSQDGKVIFSPNFTLLVYKNLSVDSEVESSDEFTVLQAAISRAESLTDGTTFTPSVSEDGVLSWTNDGGKANPEPVNIKGEDGTFRINVTSSNGVYSADKTFDEIKAAYNAGQQPYVVDDVLGGSYDIYTLSHFWYDESSTQGFADFERYLTWEDTLKTKTLRIYSDTLASGSNIEQRISAFDVPNNSYVLLVTGTESTESDIPLSSEQVTDLQAAAQNNRPITLILRDGDSYIAYYSIEVTTSSMVFGRGVGFNSQGGVDVNQALGRVIIASVSITDGAGRVTFIELPSGLTPFLPLSLSITWTEEAGSYTLTDKEYAILRQSLLDKRPIFIVRNTADAGGEQTIYSLFTCETPSILNMDRMTLVLQGPDDSIKVQMASKTIVPNITRGIVWDLTNVTSSNNAVSVADGSPIVAVLTPVDGYTLGDVTITMGGEVVTGAWNADTATVTIQSVTGDVVISCSGVVASTEEEIAHTWSNGVWKYDTTTETWAVDGSIMARCCIQQQIDATDGYLKIRFNRQTSYDQYMSDPATDCPMIEAETAYGFMNLATTKLRNLGNAALVGVPANAWQKLEWDTDYYLPAGYIYKIQAGRNIKPAVLDEDSFAYTSFGTTLNLGSSNANLKTIVTTDGFCTITKITGGSISTEVSVASSVDAQYTQELGISTMSLVPDDVESEPTTYTGTMKKAISEWMIAYKGDTRKIPVIIHTDQHGRLSSASKPIFTALGNLIPWYDVSKIMNLGDCVGDHWEDSDTANPFLACRALETMMDCLADIPISKRLDVFGNHDTWYHDADGNDIVVPDQARLSQYFRNIFARNPNSNQQGYFVDYDNKYNVKYVVVSGFEYTTSRSTYRISTAQMKWLIGEMSKDDGYDIVVVSHVPLHYATENMTFPTGYEATGTENYRVSNVDTDALFAARKNKVSGTVTDSDGVEHHYDFSGCTTEVLCALHGHTHYDAYNYVGTDGLLSVSFDWFADNTMHFVLVDRVNRQLNVWKVDSTNTVQNYQVPLDKATE